MAKAKSSVLPSKGPVKNPEWLWANDRFQETYPALYEFLASGIYEGDPRKGGSVSLFVSQGKLKASFLDKTTQLIFYAVLEALETDLLKELDNCLAGEHEPWQDAGGKGGKAAF